MNKKILITIVIFLGLSGCAANKIYRPNVIEACDLKSVLNQCNSSLELSSSNMENSKIALGFVEINDNGILRDRKQLHAIVDLISKRGNIEHNATLKKKKQVILLYVHGWNHNVQSENVLTFKSILNQYSNINPDVVVTGIYVGWRGQFLKGAPFDFWDRKGKSIKVGQGALVDVLSSIEKVVVETDSKMISIGHSFGGSALFNATRSILLSRIDQPPKFLESEPFPLHASFGNLILIINPAFEAMQYWHLYSAMFDRMQKKEPVIGREPKMIIIQGQQDTATRILFPFSGSFKNVWKFFTREHDKNSDSMISDRRIPERRLDTYGIGHFNELNTHDLTQNQGSNVDFTKCGTIVNKDFDKGEWVSPTTDLKFTPRNINDSTLGYKLGFPYWVVYDTKIIQGHNDLTNSKLNCMLVDLISAV